MPERYIPGQVPLSDDLSQTQRYLTEELNRISYSIERLCELAEATRRAELTPEQLKKDIKRKTRWP